MRLDDKLNDVIRRIGAMCHEGRPPSMSIPARPDRDDDLVICNTVREARKALSRLARMEEALKTMATEPCAGGDCNPSYQCFPCMARAALAPADDGDPQQ